MPFTFATRQDLIRALFHHKGVIAEVGVQVGHFAADILEICKPSTLYLIDSWQHHPGDYTADPANVSDEDHQKHYERVVSRFKHRSNVSIHRMLSVEAALSFEDQYFDAVYIDADHTEKGITADIKAWWPKVKEGGVLAGHDYLINQWIGVKPVVDQFVKDHRLNLITTTERWHSWAVIKPTPVVASS